jgi:WD40 repeat protein
MSLSRTLSLAAVALLGLLTPPGQAQPPNPSAEDPAPKVDRLGDPLPPGARARLGTSRFRQNGTIQFVGYSADGRMLLAAGTDQTLRFWDSRTGKELRRLTVNIPSPTRFPPRLGPAVILSGDGSTLALGLSEGECSLVDVGTGKTLRKFKTQEQDKDNKFGFGDEPAFALSRDGRVLMSFAPNRHRPDGARMRLWDTTTGKLLREVTARGEKNMNTFTAAALTRDGSALLVVEDLHPDQKFKLPPPPKGGVPKEPESSFRLIELRTGNVLQSFAGPRGTTVVQFAPDGKTIVAAGQDGAIRLFELATGKERGKLAADKAGPALDAFFAPDGKQLFLVYQNEVALWDLHGGKQIRRFPMGAVEADSPFRKRYDRAPAPPLALSPDGRTLALPDRATVTLWDVASGKSVPLTEGHRDQIDSVAFAPEGGQILTGSADGSLALWEVSTGKQARVFTLPDPGPGGPGAMRMRELMLEVFRVRGQFSPDGKTIAGLAWGGRPSLWDAQTGKLRCHLGDVSGGGYTSFAYSPDGRFVAGNGPGGALVLWSTATGKQAREFVWMPRAEQIQPGMRLEAGAYATAFAPGGRVVLGGAMLVEQAGLKVLVQGWELASGRPRLQYETRMDIGGGGPAQLESIARALDACVVSFVFSPNGKWLAQAGFCNIRMLDMRTGQEARVLGSRRVAPATTVFSPDGKYLLAGQQDGTVRLWDVASGDVLRDFPTHQGPITALAFSSDGKVLATGAKDTTVLLWDWAVVQAKATASPPKVAGVKGEALLADLESADAARAYKAMQALAGRPAEAVALLKKRLRPVPALDAARLEKLLKDLESKEPAVQEKAEHSLEDLGALAEKAVRARLATGAPEEARKRLTALLKRLEAETISPRLLLAVRGVEVLELIGTAAARKLLEELAGGAAGHRVTEEARGAVGRLRKR